MPPLPRASLTCLWFATDAPRCSIVNPAGTEGVAPIVFNSRHVQSRGAACAAVGLHNNLDILIESHQKMEQAFNRKLTELAAQHLRYIGLANAKQSSGFYLFQAPLFHDGVDLEDQLRLNEVLFRVRYPNVLKHIAASGFVSLLAHGFLSLAICSASRSRCRIKSMSRRGVGHVAIIW